MRFNHSNNCIYNIGYHIIWCPKYRKSILVGEFKIIIENALLNKAKQLEIILEKYEIMPDHIHLFIKCKPTQAIATVVQQLKGYSSYILRNKYPKYKKLYKHLWAPSYYCESVGHISEQTVKKYIEDQWLNVKSRANYR
jgi:putative transposase